MLDDLGLSPDAVDGIVHATTVATNTILEFKGAKTALITTEGFRDVLEMRRLRIPDLYNLQYEKPAPLGSPAPGLRSSRTHGTRGEVWRELDESAVEAVAAKIAEHKVEALSICLLHSYADPTHERRVAEIMKRLSQGYLHHLFQRHFAGDARIRADQHNSGQRLCGSSGNPLP